MDAKSTNQTPTVSKYDSICAALTAPYKAEVRVVLARLMILAQSRAEPDEARVSFGDLTARRVGELTGLKERQAGDILNLLNDAGIISRTTKRTAKDGQWVTDVTVVVPVSAPTTWPAIGEPTRAPKDRVRAESIRELARIGRRLQELPCPHCGVVGELHLGCQSCGTTFTAAQLAEMDEGITVSMDDQAGDQAGTVDTVAAAVAENTPFFPEFSECTTRTVGESEQVPNVEKRQSSVDVDFRQSAIGTDGDLPAISAETVGIEQPAEVLTGAETIDYLAGLGAAFCFVTPRGKVPINPRNDDGDELPWPDAPVTAEAARLHLARGGNVGLLTGRGNLALIDVDSDLAEFMARYPMMAVLPRITRPTAGDRAKLLVFVDGDCPTWHSPKGSAHKIDLLGAGAQGVIAGVHESAADIQFTDGDLLAFSWAKLIDMAREWSGAPAATRPAANPNRTITPRHEYTAPAARTDTRGLSYGEIVKSAISWWNDTPANLQTVEGLLAQCKHAGAYVAIRSDDRTPSTRASDDDYSRTVKQTWRDYGSGETMDAFEMFVRLTGRDKKAAIRETVAAWRQEVGA